MRMRMKERQKLRETKIERSGVRKGTLGSARRGSVYTSSLPASYWVQKESHCQASPNTVWRSYLFNCPIKLLRARSDETQCPLAEITF